MSDAIQTSLLIAKEDETGVIPDPPATYDHLPITAARLRDIKSTQRSQEIRRTRGIRDLVLTGWSTVGSIQAEFSIGAFNDLILAALQCEEWTEGTISVTGDLSSGVFSITGGFLPPEAQGAKFVKVVGSTAPNSGIKRVIAASSDEITFDDMPDDGTGIGLTLLYRYARNGSHFDTFTIEKQFLGLSPAFYQAFYGQGVESWNVEMGARQVLSHTFDFLGIGMDSGSSTFGDGSPNAEALTPICTGNNVSAVYFDDVALTSGVQNVRLQLANNLRERGVVTSLYNATQGSGSCDASGVITAYFEDKQLLADFLAHERRSVLLPVVDDDGSLLSVFYPVTRPRTGAPLIDGQNSDVFTSYDFVGCEDLTNGYAIQVDYLSAAEVVNADNGFETYESYATLATLNGLNGGVKFVSAWVGGQFAIGLQAIDDFEQATTYILDGSNGGEVWSASWTDGANALGVQVNWTFEDNTEGALNGQGGGDGSSVSVWVDGDFHTGVKGLDTFEDGVDGGSINGFNGGTGYVSAWVD